MDPISLSATASPCRDQRTSGPAVVGLFAGVGGFEGGLKRSGFDIRLLCEHWEPAQHVLRHRVGSPVTGDVRDLRELPEADVLTAGFPCTDLSQAGRTAGIEGEASGLVGEVFRLLRAHPVPWVVIENVRNMLFLDKGSAMSVIVSAFESLGYRWAYRLVDSRFTGVPQRRQRVILVASLAGDPSEVLFADDAGEPDPSRYRPETFGFYWTEGRSGLGWAQDAVPPLKGGSSLGIASPPAIWHPAGPAGRRILVPRIEDAERLQGLPSGWTQPADKVSNRKGVRWKLVGNAVTVGVSAWIGHRLLNPGPVAVERRPLKWGSRWPIAASGDSRGRWAVDASEYPIHKPYQHLTEVVDLARALPLSDRATAGFLRRARASKLRFQPGFLDDVAAHLGAAAAA